MLSSTITTKGQVTIPAPLRTQLNLHPGDKIDFSANQGSITIKKHRDDVTAAFGMFSVSHKVTLSEIEQAIADGATDDYC